MTKGAGWAKQAGLSAGAGPLRGVVPERASGVERAGIWNGPHVGKERERKRKGKVGRLGCAWVFRPKKGKGNQKSLFIFKNLF
jgi:hypothetical protein